MNTLKQLIILCLLWVLQATDIQAQYPSEIIEFLPAPGQFTNTNIGQSNSADDLVGGGDAMVSLGSFGGYIILGFDQPIINNPYNPYGVDFSIEGNSFGGNLYGQWCEPGAVQVMKDSNGDGLPNDGEWYELAGSDYWLSTTKRNVTITYYNPHYTVGYAVPWKADNGDFGALVANRFHTQPYYPDPFDFGTEIMDSVSFTGNRIRGTIDMSSPSYLNSYRAPVFGYCDNKGNNSPLNSPSNPYTTASDGFDLSWAVDKDGNYVELDTVNFVRVYNAGFANIGWLGEWSTEVLGIAITTPDSNYISQDYYRNYVGITQLHVLKGHTCKYDGILFKNGHPQEEGIKKWWTGNTAVGTVDSEGNFTALELGETYLYFSQKDDIAADSIPITVVELKSVVLEMEGNNSAVSSDSTSLYVNEKIYIIGECEDNRTEVLNATVANRFVYEQLEWTSSSPEVGTINNGLFIGHTPGRTMVYARSTSNPELADSILVIVNAIPEVQTIKDLVRVPAYAPQGTYASNELFTTGTDAEIIINSAVSVADSMTVSINKNELEYSFTEGVFALDTVEFNITAFGQEYDFSIIFSYMPAVFQKDGQLIFLYQEESEPQAIKSYFPATDEIETIATYESGETVKDMQIDGAFLFVATSSTLYRYNLSTYKAENTKAVDYEPQHILIYENRLFVTAIQDGRPLLASCFKSDLEPYNKINLLANASALVAMDDTLYISLDDSVSSALAVLEAGVNTISLNRIIDWGTDGVNISDLVAYNSTLFAIRKNSDTAPSAIISYQAGNTSYTVTEISDVEFQSGNTSAIINSMNGDTIMLKNKRGFTAFSTSTLTLSTSTVMRNNTAYPAGAVYNPLENIFYIAYSSSSGSIGATFSSGFVFGYNFTGLGSSPNILLYCPELSENEQPEISSSISATSIVEGKQSMVSTINKANSFSDLEGDFIIYPKTTIPFITWTRNGNNLRYSALFNGTVEDDSVVTVEIEAIDHYGCAITSSFSLTIKPRIYTPRISTLLVNQTVAVNSDDLELSLSNVFEFFDANVSAENIITVEGNTNPELVTTILNEAEDTLILSFTQGLTGQSILTLRGTTVETAPDDPENPVSKYIEFSITVTVNGVAPDAPVDLTIDDITETSVKVSWSEPANNADIAGYNVYANDELQGTVTDTVFTISGLAAATTYTISVEAFDATGNKSAKVSVSISTTDETAPTAPADLTGTPTKTTIALSWTASTDNVAVIGYNVYVGDELVGTATEASYSLTGLTAATEYQISVEAVDSVGNTSEKASVTISTLTGTGISITDKGVITMYPNPFNSFIILEATTDGKAIIYDVSGKPVLQVEVNTGTNTINTSDLGNGVYILKYGTRNTAIIKINKQ